MGQLTYTGRGTVEWRETAAPAAPGLSEALVRPLAVARCDLDLALVTKDLFPGPFAVGHEAVAEVITVGERVRAHRPGDRVMVPFQVSCGACARCRGGHFAACLSYRASAGAMFGFGEVGGGHGGAVAETLLVPAGDHLLVSAPAALSPTALATLPDNVVDAYRGVGPPLAENPGVPVLVVAGGFASIGLYAVAMALALGASGVRYLDQDQARCEAAEALGAEVHHRRGPWPKRMSSAPITVDGSGEIDGLACALRSTEPYGHCTSSSIFFAPTTPLPLLDMYTRGVTLHTSRADSRRFLPAVGELAATGIFDPLAVPTTVVPWEDADAAWTEPAIKLVVQR